MRGEIVIVGLLISDSLVNGRLDLKSFKRVEIICAIFSAGHVDIAPDHASRMTSPCFSHAWQTEPLIGLDLVD